MRIGRLCARRACAILCFGWLALPALATPPAPPLLLAEVYDEAVDPAAYWVSEKLDGVRAYWDGRQLYFRSGQAVAAPAWFTANFPAQPLDGELWLGRGQFDRLSAIVRKQTPDDADWRAVRYLIFELPNAPGSFSARVAAIERLLAQTGVAWLQAVRQFRVADRGELFTRLDAVVAGGGEGLMLARLRYRMMPIFDHVLATEPLAAEQQESIGWRQRQGLTDMGNQFHYYRLTPDNRILWGGYDAIYYRGNRTDPRLEQRDASHELLATQFFDTFPQLAGIQFTHKWAGIIDSTSRFTPAIGTAHGGNLAYAVGYTGLGTAAARFGALTMLDLLDGADTERTRLTLVRRKPFPFPPEPLRYPLIQFTRAQLAKEDLTGRRGAWLRLLDHFGLGFNS